ncbi:MAG: hypothetical protein RL196_651 [Actinomycetota bacterium]
MRFYVKDSQRKPDPAPVKTNAKLAIAVGTGLWVLAALFFLFAPQQLQQVETWQLATCGVGIALGVFGFVHVSRKR